LQGEIVLLQRKIVFQLVVLEDGPALARDVVHLDGAGRPDAAREFEVAILNRAREAVLVVCLTFTM
jgi:hypothetical protein